MSAALVLTGAPGAGKSSILGALATRLEIEGIEFGAIESEHRGVAATGAERAFVVCLTASADTVARRLDEREPDLWPGKRALIAHARELAVSIPRLGGIDLHISTENRNAHAVADEIFAARVL